ncbi:MAG: isoaspartyl peptidase/L-asparaginase [Bacteroidota bacterium]
MKFTPYLFLLLLAGCVGLSKEQEAPRPEYVMAIHGGAGTISKDLMTPELETAYRSALQAALDKGESILKAGGSSADAVEATIHILEESPLFNAGKGAVFTHEETVELDASFMDGATLNAGAVAGVKTLRHPISAARLVMDSSVHVMMAGTGADAFGEKMGLEIVENDFFYTDRRLKQVQDRKQAEMEGLQSMLNPREPVLKKYGTVGCVALDKNGNLAAGTSTGGMTNKRYGRVGDAPIIGAGTYANNASCAISCTGHGEYFIRNVVAHDVAARMMYKGLSLEQAAGEVIYDMLPPQGGTGGLVAVDKDGNVALPFNTPGMFRGFVKSTGETGIDIYKEE